MVRVQVTDSSNRPVDYAEVIIKWDSGGVSSRRTNRNGVADMEISARTAEYVQVNGKRVLGKMWLEGTIEVRI